MTQVRLVSLQGKAVYKHFTSNQHVYVHTNPRLDLCVIHPEQNLKRSGEMKMMWMQNEGYIMRPRLEILEELQVGDHVWIYGMSAHESLFDEEKAPEPLMVPTGVRAVVKAVTREHFFLDTRSLEGDHNGTIHMGMCGSAVMRNGRCVGMLTATVHEDTNVKELANTAMCTYAKDIFEFLLEVEKQMKNPPPTQHQNESQFMEKRRKEGAVVKEHRDWAVDQSRTARHIPVPISLWHMEQSWVTEEDFMTTQVFGRSGVFNQETQESALGYDMNSAKTNGERPGDMPAFSTAVPDSKVPVQGQRKDYYPEEGVYAPPESFKTKDVWDYEISSEMRSLFDKTIDSKDATSLNNMRQSLENIRAQRAKEKMKETVIQQAAGRGKDAMKEYGYYSDGSEGNLRDFDPNLVHGAGGERPYPPQDVSYEDHQNTNNTNRETPASPVNDRIAQKKQEKREAEAKYQEELRRRHGHKAVPFGDEDLRGMWEVGPGDNGLDHPRGR
ncbi:hypothetical protein AGDE_10668 [Angomonas deanei]|uniref:Uncharacterized protein n=1 Tax=Angomonas deanei TaxID=59799 RepID=A0A7G2CAN8_9TRYP|nr:hypothetical protein AGDE_10668 [Angomonas deanei]CAD2216856.1 hypothetical protein, conserved [Angomonas deanei]|eukprot:EPY27634.1 hypothetical protein AGDE_10668 [Angomonas deanei]